MSSNLQDNKLSISSNLFRRLTMFGQEILKPLLFGMVLNLVGKSLFMF